MAAELAVGYVTLVPSAKGFKDAIKAEIGDDIVKAGGDVGDKTAKSFGSRFSSGMKTVAKAGALAFAGAAGAAAVFGKAAVDAASNQAESLSKVGVVFGDSAAEIEAWADGAAKAFGQSKTAALESVGTYGNLLQAFGLTGDAAKTMSIDMVELASDLASFNNTSIEDALTALQSGLAGESEPLKRYGVALSDVRLRQEALAQGLIKSTKDAMTPAIKAQATYGLILKDTTLAQGDFARTSDGLANKQRIANAQFENLKAQLGEALIPVMQKLTEVALKVVAVISENWPEIKATISEVIDRVRDAWENVGKPVFDAIVEATTALTEWTEEHWDQISGYVEGAIKTVRTVIQTFVGWATQFWRTFGEQVAGIAEAAWNYVKRVIDAALKAIRGIIDVIMGLIRLDFSQVWDGIKQIFGGAVDAIKAQVKLGFDLIRQVASAAMTALAGILDGAWDGIKRAASATWDALVGFVRDLPGRFANALASLPSILRNLMSNAFNAAKDVASDAIDAVVGFIRGLPGRILAFVGDVAGAARRVGGAVLEGLKDGAGAVADAVLGAIKGAINRVIDLANAAIPDRIGVEVDIPFIGKKFIGFGVPQIPHPFHEGGVVPGSAGSEVAAILQAGEVVFTQAQQRALVSALTARHSEAQPAGTVINGDVVTANPREFFAELDRREWRAQMAAAAA